MPGSLQTICGGGFFPGHKFTDVNILAGVAVVEKEGFSTYLYMGGVSPFFILNLMY